MKLFVKKQLVLAKHYFNIHYGFMYTQELSETECKYRFNVMVTNPDRMICDQLIFLYNHMTCEFHMIGHLKSYQVCINAHIVI